jgi:hypothetical protein
MFYRLRAAASRFRGAAAAPAAAAAASAAIALSSADAPQSDKTDGGAALAPPPVAIEASPAAGVIEPPRLHLVSAQVLMRHGARTPVHAVDELPGTFCKDAFLALPALPAGTPEAELVNLKVRRRRGSPVRERRGYRRFGRGVPEAPRLSFVVSRAATASDARRPSLAVCCGKKINVVSNE